MKPRLRLAYLDETEDWAEEIAQVAGRIAGLYIYDPRRWVYCCEITPSYELYLAGYLTEHHVSDKVQIEMVQAAECGSIHYIHCWRLNGFRRARRRPGFRDIDPFGQDSMPCTLALPGPYPSDPDQAMVEALEALPQCGFTTT